MQTRQRCITHKIGQLVTASCFAAISGATAWAQVDPAPPRDPPAVVVPSYGPGVAGHIIEGPLHRSAGRRSLVQSRLQTRLSLSSITRIAIPSERPSPMAAAISLSVCRRGLISGMCKWSICLVVRKSKRR
jgi:hypothetical protein